MTEPTTAAGRALRLHADHVEPGTACPECGAILHGYPCIHHEDDCPTLAIEAEIERLTAELDAYKAAHAATYTVIEDL